MSEERRTANFITQPMADELDLTESLRDMGLIGPHEQPLYTALSGGVSSEIWRVDLRYGPICMKRALSKLRVEQDWFAPIDRCQYEVRWLSTVGLIASEAAPKVLGFDGVRHLIAMEFLDPSTYLLWKLMLRDGLVHPAFAADVGRVLAHIHASTSDRPDIASAFASDAIFREIRLEPYFAATAERHPDLACRFRSLMEATAQVRRVMVHGDVSPKNILVGPNGPVFLDAECAWYGDPAFDLAFCLNHMLLKCLWVPRAAHSLLACFDSLSQAYLRGVTWEYGSDLEARAAALLPGLLLARIDGKSPVEYLMAEADKDRVRRVARKLIRAQPEDLFTIRNTWAVELGVV